MSNTVLDPQNIERTFIQGGVPLPVLRGCTLHMHAGETVALIGPSGSGKSTFLQIVGLLEKPDAGALALNGKVATNLDDCGRTALRRDAIGFVYQFHHLLPEFSALENIMLPQMLAGVSCKMAQARAEHLLDLVDLRARTDHRPARLSGGEQQRVALVRALANSPKILIADEPTGNLDPLTSEHVFDFLLKLVASEKLALLMATHNHDLARKMGRTVAMQNGMISQL